MRRSRECPYCGKYGKGIIKTSNQNKVWTCSNCGKEVVFIKRSKEELKSQLTNQIQLIINSCESFDKGSKIEATNIATKIRVLLHEGNSSSLMSQLGKKDMLFYDTGLNYDSRNPFPHIGLINIIKLSEGDEFFVPLDKEKIRYLNGKIAFERWWDKLIVLEDSNKNPFTRKDLITKVANKDGGAHVDLYLDEEYYNLTRNESTGWKPDDNIEEGYILGAELASIRQIAHEVLKSIKDEFPEIFESNDLIIPTPKNDKSQKNEIVTPPGIIVYGDTAILKDLEFKHNGLKVEMPGVIAHRPNGKSKKYKHKTDFSDLESEIDVDSLVYYLDNSKTIDYWASYIESLGINVWSAGIVDPRIIMLKRVNITKIGELDDLLENSKEWGKKYLKGVCSNIFGENHEGKSLLRDGILLYFIIGNFPDIFTDDVLEHEFGAQFPENITVPAMVYNPNYAEK